MMRVSASVTADPPVLHAPAPVSVMSGTGVASVSISRPCSSLPSSLPPS